MAQVNLPIQTNQFKPTNQEVYQKARRRPVGRGAPEKFTKRPEGGQLAEAQHPTEPNGRRQHGGNERAWSAPSPHSLPHRKRERAQIAPFPRGSSNRRSRRPCAWHRLTRLTRKPNRGQRLTCPFPIDSPRSQVRGQGSWPRFIADEVKCDRDVGRSIDDQGRRHRDVGKMPLEEGRGERSRGWCGPAPFPP